MLSQANGNNPDSDESSNGMEVANNEPKIVSKAGNHLGNNQLGNDH
jgi:hypothetical protein